MLKQVSCVLKLCDSAQNRPLSASQVQIFLDGMQVRPLYKTGGYFVLIDLREGVHHIAIHASQFQSDELDVTVDHSRGFDERLDVVNVMLNPNESHPAAASGVSVRGRFAGGKTTVFYVARSRAQLKIAEDGAQTGRQRIKLFCGGVVRLPSLFQICDKAQDQREFVMINAADGDEYLLGSPLRFAHRRSTELLPMVKYVSGADGSFFAVLPSGYRADASGKIEVEMLAETDGGLKSVKLSLDGKGLHDVGEISV